MKYAIFCITDCVAGLKQICDDLDDISTLMDSNDVSFSQHWFIDHLHPRGIELSEMSYDICICVSAEMMKAYMGRALEGKISFLSHVVLDMYTVTHFGEHTDTTGKVWGRLIEAEKEVSSECHLHDLFNEWKEQEHAKRFPSGLGVTALRGGVRETGIFDESDGE